MVTPEIRTSSTHPIYVDWLDAPARVGLTLAPGVRARSTEGFRWQRDLDADLEELVLCGATGLVCLLEDEELVRYGIGGLFSSARSRGLALLRLPIPDRGLPRGLDAVDGLFDAMKAHEAKGGRLVIHCRGGLGRTGTIAGCYLVRSGRTAVEALEILRRVRNSDRCPESAEQRSFIARYERHRLRLATPPVH